MPQAAEVVILGKDGQEHVFPPGFDPTRAAAIVRSKNATLSAPMPTVPQPQQRLAGVGMQTVSDEEWAQMSPAERVRGIAKAVGYGLTSMMGMGQAGREAVDHPGITLATAAVPVVARGVRAVIPSKVAAGKKFQQVMGKAKDIPLDIAGPGKVALEVAEKGSRGGTTPRSVTSFLRRITDPDKGPLTYEEARDWASNISRLSADEYNRLTPVMRREMIRLRVALNEAVKKAAASIGEGKQYQSAMREFARASSLEDFGQDVWKGVKRSLPWVGVTGAGAYVGSRMADLIRPE